MSGIEIYPPEGSIGNAPLELARMPREFSGLRLIGLDNGKPGAALLLEKVGERLASRVGVDFIGVLAKGSAATPCEDERFEEILERSDLIITATAD